MTIQPSYIVGVTRIGVLLLISIVLLTGGACDLNEYTPSVEVIKKNESRVFMVEPTEVESLYGNLDVDSLIYSYRTTVSDADLFWSCIEQRAVDHGWKLVKREIDDRQYELVENHPGGMPYKHQVAVAINRDTLEVVLGWAREDGERTQSGEDGWFFADVLLPKLQAMKERMADSH